MHNLEEFNSDRSVLRVTTERIPNSNTLQKEIALPIGIIVKPYGDAITVNSRFLSLSENFRERKLKQ